jgi:two-component system OmpR family sensor kinase
LQATRAHAGDNGIAPVPDDALLGALNHTLVNALNSISAASKLAEMLLDGGESGKAAKSLMGIEGECMRAARLLRDARAFVGFKIGPVRQRIDVMHLMHSCVQTLTESGEVVVEADGDLPTVSGDADALRRLVVEVLDNAFQFGARELHVILGSAASDREVQITFHDDGPGIAPGTDVFAPFVSTLPREHSGLGLPLAARIAAAHGGAIGLLAAEYGAALWVRLPV